MQCSRSCLCSYLWKNVGYTNETNDSDTNTLSDKKHKTHYWMYTVFDDKSWNECQQKGIMVLGMDDIGDYSQFCFPRKLSVKN